LLKDLVKAVLKEMVKFALNVQQLHVAAKSNSSISPVHHAMNVRALVKSVPIAVQLDVLTVMVVKL